MFKFDQDDQLDRNNLPIKERKSTEEIFDLGSKRPSRVPSGLFDTNYYGSDRDVSTERFQYGEGQNQEAVRAGYQSNWDLFRNASLQGAGEGVFGTLEGLGYLFDLQQIGDIANGTEGEFSNWFSDLMKSAKEYVNEEIAPIDRTEAAQTGFAPMDGSWWASNAGNIMSTVSLLVPAGVATKGLSYAGKGLRAAGKGTKLYAAGDKASDAIKIGNKLLYGEHAEQVATGVTQAVFSRYMENTMEASGTYDQTYQTLISQGIDPKEAAVKAGDAAATAWQNNWGNLVFDIAQYMTFTKGMNAANYASKEFRRNLLQKGGMALGNMAQEGIEEGVQFVVSEEAQRKAVKGKDYEGLKDITTRIGDYLEDPEMKASLLLGAVGGGVFSGLGGLANKIQEIGDKSKAALSYQAALDSEDIVTASKISGAVIAERAYEAARKGKLNDLRSFYDKMGQATDEELAAMGKTPEEIAEFREKHKEILADIDFVGQEYLRTYGDSSKSEELKLDELNNRYTKHILTRIKKQAQERLNEVRKKAKDTLTPQELEKKEKSIELAILKLRKANTDFSNIKDTGHGKSFIGKIDERIQTLEKELEEMKDVSVKPTAVDPELVHEVGQKVSQELNEDNVDSRLEQTETPKGKAEYEQELKKEKETARLKSIDENTDLDTIDSVLSDPTIKDKARRKLNTIANKGEKEKPIPSKETYKEDIADRYSNKPLLMRELAKLKKQGVNVPNNIKDAASFIKQYDSVKKFRDAVDNMFSEMRQESVKNQSPNAPIPSQEEEANASSEETMDALPSDSGYEKDTSIIQNHEFAMYIDNGDGTITITGIDSKKKKLSIEEAKEKYGEIRPSNNWMILYDKGGAPIKSINNNLTIVNEDGDFQDIDFLTDEEFDIINDPDSGIEGSVITFEVPMNNAWSPNRDNVNEKNFIVIPTITVNGKKVRLGKLSAANKNQPAVAKLRELIYNEWKSSGQTEDTFESKKADIERRRQEELGSRVVNDGETTPTAKDGEFKIIGDNRLYRINEFTGRPQVFQDGFWTNEALPPNLFFHNVKKSGWQKSKDQINAKYDAELAALEESSTSTQGTFTSTINNVKVGGRTPGKFNIKEGNLKQSPHTVTTEPLFFGVVKKTKAGVQLLGVDNGKNIGIDETPVYDPHSKLLRSPGNTVMFIRTGSGEYSPIKLFTKKLKELPQETEEVNKIIDSIFADEDIMNGPLKSEEAQQKLDGFNAKLQEYLAITIKREGKGKLFHESLSVEDSQTSETFTDAESLKASLLNKVMRIDAGLINTVNYKDGKNYNEYISEKGWVKTNISPDRKTLASQVKMNMNAFNKKNDIQKAPKKEHATVKTLEEKKAEIEERREASIQGVFSRVDYTKEEKDAAFKEIDSLYAAEIAALEELQPSEADIKENTQTQGSNKESKGVMPLKPKTRSSRARVPKNERKRAVTGTEYTKWNPEQELKWFTKTYPNVPISVLKDLKTISNEGGVDLWGLFKNGAVYIADHAATGTVYHEAFHVVFNTLLTDRERKELLSEVNGKDDIAKEEYLADRFMDHKLTEGLDTQDLSKKVLDVFKRLYHLIQIAAERIGIKGSASVEDYMYRTDKGLYNIFNIGKKFKKDVSRFRTAYESGSLSPREESMAIDTINSVVLLDVMETFKETLELSEDTAHDDVIREILKKGKEWKNSVYSIEGIYASAIDQLGYDLEMSKRPDVTEDSPFYMDEKAQQYLERVINSFGEKQKDGSYVLSSLVARASNDLGVRFGLGISAERIVSDEDVKTDENLMEGWMLKDSFSEHYSKFSARAKVAFASVPKGNDPAGYVVFEAPNVVYSKLANTLVNSRNEADMKSKLDSLVELYPRYSDIRELLDTDPKFSAELWINMGQKHNVPFIGQSLERNGTVTSFVSNRKSLEKDIISTWRNDVYDSKYYDASTGKMVGVHPSFAEQIDTLIKDVQKVRTLSAYEEIAEDSVDILYEILEELQILIPKIQLTRLFGHGNGKKPLLKFLGSGKEGLRNVVNTMIDGNDPFVSTEVEDNKALNTMATVVSQGKLDLYQRMFRGMDGQQINSIIDNRFSLSLLNDLKHDKNTLSMYRRDPFYKNSPFLNLFDNITEAENIQIGYVDGFRKNSSETLEYSKMSPQQFEAFQLNAWFGFGTDNKQSKYGNYFLPVLADATVASFIQAPKQREADVLQALVNTAMQERDRIEALQREITPVQEAYDAWLADQNNDKKSALEKAPLPSELSHIPYALLKNGLKYQIFTGLEGVSNDNFYDAVVKIVKDAVRKEGDAFFEEGIIERIEDSKGNVSYKDRTGMIDSRVLGNINSNLDTYLLNRMYMNLQTLFLFNGDPAYYKSKKGEVDFTDVYKRVKQIHSPQNKISVDINNTYTSPDGEVVRVRPAYKVSYVQDPTEVEAIQSEHMDIIEELFGKDSWIAEKYRELNNTDAATFIDLFRLREIYVGTARWTDALQEQYDALISGKPFVFNVDEQLNVLKPFNFSHQETKRTPDHHEVRMVPTQHKNSEMLITPRMAIGNPKLQKVLEKMGYTFNKDGTITFNTNDRLTDAVMFTSAVKVGQFKVVNSLDEITELNVHTFSNENYAIQQQTPEHYIDAQTNYGSQIRKLMVQDLDMEAAYEVPGMKDPIKGSELFKIYQEAMNRNITEAFDQLKKTFYKEDGSPDLDGIVKILRKEVIERKLGDDYLKALEWLNDNRTETMLPLWHPQVNYQVESIMNSFFKNNVTKQKISGPSLYNSSSWGFEKDNKKGLRKPEIKFNTDKDGNRYIKEIEVILPVHTKHIYDKYLGEDGFVDINKVPDFFKRGIFYRIPTEGKYSMFHVKVIGYLEGVGGQMVLPDEATTIAGLDFDIDKMFGMMYAFDTKGDELVKVPSSMDTKKGRDNLLIDLQYAIMSHPTTIKKQLTPGNFETLRKAAKKVIDLEGKAGMKLNPMLPSTQREVFDRNMTGAALIGVGANHNVTNAIMQAGNFKFTDNIAFNGNEERELSKREDVNGNPTSANTAEFIAAFVDNAKDPLASFLNLTTSTTDVAEAMVRVGHPLYEVLMFMASPAAKRFSKLLTEEKDTSPKTIENLLNRLQEEAKEEMKTFTDLKNLDEFFKTSTSERVTLEKIEESFKRKNPLEDLKTDYSVYQLLQSTFKKAQALTTTMNGMRYDSVGSNAAGPTMAHTNSLKRKFQAAMNADGIHITGFKDFINSGAIPYVESFYKYGILMPSTETIEITERVIEPITQVVEEEVGEFTFSYLGRTINTEFQLSEDQQKALRELIDFAKSKDPRFILQGAAGTGKTSIIGYLSKYLNTNMLYFAPTHAATVELAFATMKTGNKNLPMTVASGLAINSKTGKTTLSKKAKEIIRFSKYIVLDEVSMLQQKEYKRIKDLEIAGYKVIFLGDKKQIPEVISSNPKQKNISEAFTENPTANLDTIHRTSNNNIKNVLQKVRDSKEFKLYKVKDNTEHLKFYDNDLNFLEKLKETVTEDPENTDYIGYTNNSVSAMNKMIRENIFGRTGIPQEGDIIMGYLGYASKQIERKNLANSVSFTIENIQKKEDPSGSYVGYNIKMSSKRLKDLNDNGFKKSPTVSQTVYLPLFSGGALEHEFTQEELNKNNTFLSKKFESLHQAFLEAQSKKTWWKYYTALEEMSRLLSNLDLDMDVIYNHKTNKIEPYNKSNPSQVHRRLYGSERSKFVVEKGIDYGHAITIHKSQGRTTKNVFFDANTINKNDIKILENGEQISTERQSLGYVGMSRASDNLYVNEGWVNFEEIDNVSDEIVEETRIKPKEAKKETTKAEPQLPTIIREEQIAYGDNIIMDVAKLPYDKPVFEQVVQTLDMYSNIMGKGNIDPEATQKVYEHIMTAFNTAYPTFGHGEIEEVITKLPKALRDYQKKNPEGEYSKFVDRFNVVPSNKYVPFRHIQFDRNGLDSLHIQDMRRTWERMLNSEDKISKNIASRLVQYAFFSTGYTQTFNTFSDMIPTSFYTQLNDNRTPLSYREFLSGMFNREFTPYEIEQLFEQVVRNSFRSMGSVPYLDKRDNKDFKFRQIDGELYFVVPTKYVRATEDPKGGSTYHPITGEKNPFIDFVKTSRKTADGKAEMILFGKPVQKGGEVLYRLTERAGIHNNFVEYDMNVIGTDTPMETFYKQVEVEYADDVEKAESPDERIKVLKQLAADMSIFKLTKGDDAAQRIRQSIEQLGETLGTMSNVQKEVTELGDVLPSGTLKEITEFPQETAEEIIKRCKGK